MSDLIIFVLAVSIIWISILLTYRKLSLAKRGVTLSPGVLMWRTKKGLTFIDKLSRKFRRGWIFYGTLAAALGFILMIFIFGGLVSNTVLILLKPREAMPGVRFILPGTAPGLTVIVWLIVVGVVLIFHELFHALLLRSQGLRTKSVGVLLFLFIPGAFVEPDEKEVKRSKPGKRLRMFAAGPVTNVVISIMFLLVLLFVVSPKQGVYVWAVAENNPLENENILGARVLFLDNFRISSLENVRQFKRYLSSVQREEFELVTDRGSFRATIIRKGEENYLPFLSVQAPPRFIYLHPLNMALLMYDIIFGAPTFHPYLYESFVHPFVLDLLKWLFALNLGVGLFNLLPAKPLDGGYMLEALLETRYPKKSAERAIKLLSFLVLFLIILNIMPMVMRL